nr:unnamed protein product [Digitaria exilis]
MALISSHLDDPKSALNTVNLSSIPGLARRTISSSPPPESDTSVRWRWPEKLGSGGAMAALEKGFTSEYPPPPWLKTRHSPQ